MLLAIDTATQTVSIALHDGQHIVAEHTWFSPNQHTRQVPIAVRTMLRDAGVAPSALTAVAVTSGPGSYTGLRVGISLAKGIAAGKHLPLVGVSTFDILAYAAPQTTGALIVTLMAGRSRISVARYQWRKGAWRGRGEPENMIWEELLASIDGAATITGEIDDVGQTLIAQAQAGEMLITVMPASTRLRRAGTLADMAWVQLRSEKGNSFPAALVVPSYVKTKDSPA